MQLIGPRARISPRTRSTSTLPPVDRSYEAREVLESLALDRLATTGEIEISVESVPYRSAFVGAVLCSPDEAECSPATMRVWLVDP